MAEIPQAGVTVSQVTSGYTIINGPLSPLTTTFTYPSSCINHWVQLQPGDPISSISLYSKRGIGSYFESCQPDSGTIGPYYSPGVCPSGQTIATIIEYSTASATGGGSDRQWAAICCLSGFAVDFNEIACTSSMYSSAALAYRAVTWTSAMRSPNGDVYTSRSLDYDATSNTTTVSYASFIANPLIVLWKSSDLSKFEPSYASLLASRLNIKFAASSPTPSTTFASRTASPGSSVGIAAITSTSTPPPPPSPPSGSNKLSTGAKAGIGVGAVIGALALAAVIFLLFAWRKRKATHRSVSQGDYPAATEQPELVQYHNPGRESQALNATYPEHVSNTPTSPRNMP